MYLVFHSKCIMVFSRCNLAASYWCLNYSYYQLLIFNLVLDSPLATYSPFRLLSHINTILLSPSLYLCIVFLSGICIGFITMLWFFSGCRSRIPSRNLCDQCSTYWLKTRKLFCDKEWFFAWAFDIYSMSGLLNVLFFDVAELYTIVYYLSWYLLRSYSYLRGTWCTYYLNKRSNILDME